MSKVAIIDYGMSNLDSMQRAVEECGGSPVMASTKADMADCTHVILPGVGAFPDGMAQLKQLGLDEILHEIVIEKQTPFLGVCLGMQLLAQWGNEGRRTQGLGWVPGTVERLSPVPGERVPHIGWNEVNFAQDTELSAGIENGKDFYFVHSFVMKPESESDILATTPYGGGFVSAVKRQNIWGVQFHPEKSQRAGFALLTNFLQI